MLNSISYAALQLSPPSRTAKSLMLVLNSDSDLCYNYIPKRDILTNPFFGLCIPKHSSAKMSSLVPCFEYVSPLPFVC